jgi:hypothetical protein
VRVLVACEYSGRVRDAFTVRGHYAVSVDLLPSETEGLHYQGDVRGLLREPWDLVIAFPPCTDLSVANANMLKVKEADGRMASAVQFFMACYNANASRVAVENPVGVIPRFFRRYDQLIDPWWFGDPYKKRTCLWLRGLPKLIATHTQDDYPEGISYWHSGSGYTPSAQRNGARAEHRGFHARGKAVAAKDRSRTFPGLAQAMADQWGSRLTS